MAVQMQGPHTQGPNLFELRYEDTKITYAPSVCRGSPRLHYSGPMGQHTFEGDEITTMRSARGLEISVTLDRVSHLRTIHLTVFVPDIELEGATSELSFRTVGIHATRRRPMTTGVGGAALTSEPLEFDGLAKNIEFRIEEPALPLL
jgi:hypothetical protein